MNIHVLSSYSSDNKLIKLLYFRSFLSVSHSAFLADRGDLPLGNLSRGPKDLSALEWRVRYEYRIVEPKENFLTMVFVYLRMLVLC